MHQDEFSKQTVDRNHCRLIPLIVAMPASSHHWPINQAREPNVCTYGSSRTEQDYRCNAVSSAG